MHGISQRPLGVGDIEYIYIPKERTSSADLFPPVDIDLSALHLLGSLPKNLLQLNDTFTHFSDVKLVQTLNPYRFSVYYPESIPHLIEFNPYKVSCKIFFLHAETENLDSIIKILLSNFLLVFIIRIDVPYQTIVGFEEYCITSPNNFFQKLLDNKNAVERILLESFPRHQLSFKINLDIKSLHHSYNPKHDVRVCDANYYTLNQTLGNVWDDKFDNEQVSSETIEVRSSDPNDPTRFKLILGQLEKMDQLEIITLEDRGVKFPNFRDEWLSPLILIAPFNYPSLGKILDPKIEKNKLNRLKKILSYEQALNYIAYSSSEGLEVEDAISQGHLLMLRTRYLDFLGFLHASFTNSPVVRFPQLANSIKLVLSFFKPETINQKKWLNSKRLIDNFGRELSKLIIPKGLDKDVFLIPRQIVAITDLPIEWLYYKEHNLSFLYDVTRIPELPFGGILASFSTNAHFQYIIKNDILSKTLILLGASKDYEFKSYFETIEKDAKELGYNTSHCSSVQDVIDKIDQYKPELLIFDCHGGYDSNTLSSYLLINGEKLTGDDIVKYKICAPLVFLSACHTNPNYGYLNKLADAFFEAGTIAITATYFPISIHSGSNIYYRLLHNLSMAAKVSVHKNWLSFVSHVIRTSYYKDVIYATQNNVINSSLSDDEKERTLESLLKINKEIGLQFLRFDLRPKAIDLFFKKLNEMVPKELISKKIIHEYMFYTNMGRGDLVRFECWERKFDELNGHNNQSRFKG